MQHELIQEALERSLKEHVAIPLRGSIPCNGTGRGKRPWAGRFEVAIPLRGPIPCNTIAPCFVKWGAVWGGRNPLTGLNPLQQWWETLFEAAAPGRNPLTGLNPLQLGRTASSAPSL